MTSYESENTGFSIHPMLEKCSNIDIRNTMEVDEIVHAFLISQICIYGEVSIKESIIVSLKTTYIVMNCFHLIVCGG